MNVDNTVRQRGTKGQVRRTTSQNSSIVDVRSVGSRSCQQNVVQGVLTAHRHIVGGSNDVHFGTIQVEGSSTLSLNLDICKVIASQSTTKGYFLNGQRYGPVLVGIEGEQEVLSAAGGVDGVLTAVQKTNLYRISNRVGRLVDGDLSRLTENDRLIGKLIRGDVSASPLIDGVVHQVLEAGHQVGSSLMGDVLGVLVDISHQIGTGISQGHPLEAIAFAMSSSSSANKSTTSSVKLSVGGRGDQISLILSAVESGRNALGVVLRNTLQVGLLADDVLDVVGVLHEHEVASDGEDFGYDREISSKGRGRNGYVAILRIEGRVKVIDQTEITHIGSRTNSGVRLNCLSHSGGNGGGDFAIVDFVTSNVVHRNCHGNTEPFTTGGVTGGAVSGNQLQTIDSDLSVNNITSHQRRGQVSAVKLRARGEEFEFHNLVGSADADNTEVANLSVSKKLLNAVVAQEGNTRVRNSRISYANQCLIIVKGADFDGGVEREASRGNILFGFN